MKHTANVVVIGTGGTIASIGRGPLDLIEYAVTGQKLEADEIVARVPILAEVANVRAVRFKAVSSTDMGPVQWLQLARLIEQLAAQESGIDGFVITHGTATTEETAYFLNLVLHVRQPVVVVGSQRPASGLSTDADINLVNAVRTAASPDSLGLGVLVMLNDEIQAAREVTKTSTLRMQTFKSPDFGVLGHVDADAVSYYRRPIRRHAPDTEFSLEGLETLPRVDIVYSYAGADGTAIDAFVAAGCRGLVSAGFAPGSGTKAETAAMERAIASGVAVVQSTRAGSGRVTQRQNLSEKGIIAADNLSPQKARILLMLALTRGNHADELARIFATY
ncbi:MAG: asparaginase [Gammaproteobacteria bacterium]|nr:asparaginase [Gammaproteobacteria bacterium]